MRALPFRSNFRLLSARMLLNIFLNSFGKSRSVGFGFSVTAASAQTGETANEEWRYEKSGLAREFSKPIIRENCRPDDRSLVKAWASLRNDGARSAICRAPVRK